MGVGKVQVWLVNLTSESAVQHEVTPSKEHPLDVRRHGFGLFFAFLVH